MAQGVKTVAIKILKVLLPVSVGLILCYLIYNQLTANEKADLFESLRTARYEWFALSLLLGALSHVVRAYRWKFLLRPLGKQPAFKHSFYAVMIGYLFNMVLPRAGEASRALALSRSENIPFERTLGTIFAERVVDMLILLGIMLATFYLQFDVLEDQFNALQSGLAAKFSWAFGIVMALGVAAVYTLFKYGRRSQNPVIRKIYLLGLGFYAGLKTIVKMRGKGYFLFHSALIWVLYVAMYWVCFFTIEETSNVPVAGVFAGFVMGSFAVVLFPGGIGAFPVAIQKALLLYGVGGAFGFALGWIMWFAQSIMIVFLGIISLYLTPKFNAKRAVDHA